MGNERNYGGRGGWRGREEREGEWREGEWNDRRDPWREESRGGMHTEDRWSGRPAGDYPSEPSWGGRTPYGGGGERERWGGEGRSWGSRDDERRGDVRESERGFERGNWSGARARMTESALGWQGYGQGNFGQSTYGQGGFGQSTNWGTGGRQNWGVSGSLGAHEPQGRGNEQMAPWNRGAGEGSSPYSSGSSGSSGSYGTYGQRSGGGSWDASGYGGNRAGDTGSYGRGSWAGGGYGGGQYGGASFGGMQSSQGSAWGSQGMGSWGGGTEQLERGAHIGRGPKNYRRSDERIREDVAERMKQHGELDASDIDVRVSQGEVTLEGTVSSRQEKRIAEECAEGVSGVDDVDNKLKVKRRNESDNDTSRQQGTASNSATAGVGSTGTTSGSTSSTRGTASSGTTAGSRTGSGRNE